MNKRTLSWICDSRCRLLCGVFWPQKPRVAYTKPLELPRIPLNNLSWWLERLCRSAVSNGTKKCRNVGSRRSNRRGRVVAAAQADTVQYHFLSLSHPLSLLRTLQIILSRVYFKIYKRWVNFVQLHFAITRIKLKLEELAVKEMLAISFWYWVVWWQECDERWK